MKINTKVLRRTVISLVLDDQTVPVSNNDVIEATGKELSEAISFPWVYDFCHRHNITNRIRTGNKSLSPAQVAIINKYLSYHLGRLKRSYDNSLDESTVENFDETHIVVYMDNGRVLYFQGSNRVTYLDVANGRDCFTVCMGISGGQNARIEKPLLIFQNPNGNYPISGIQDNVDGITYRSSPKGWMTAQMFVNYFSDPNIIQPLDNNSIRTIWIDSCRIHRESMHLVDALPLSRTELKRFQSNCTSTAQPLEQLLLRTFKAEWRKRWDRKRNELVRAGEFTSTGRIRNPGKYFFLQLVKEVVDELNSRTIGNLTLDKKSLIICGLIPGENGTWELSQLTPKLRRIVQSNLPYFNEQDPGT